MSKRMACCVFDRRRIAKFREPENVIGDLLWEDAYRLICDSESGANQDDFRTEFYSYWNRGLSTETQKVRSLLIPRGPSRLVRYGGVKPARSSAKVKPKC